MLKNLVRATKVAGVTAAPARSVHLLKQKMAEAIPKRREEFAALNKAHGDTVIDQVTVGQLTGGMRGIKCMLWETSLLDSNEGIRYRGKTIPELQAALPGVERPGLAKGEPIPEATLWYLMTGEVPTKEEVKFIQEDLHKRSAIPEHVKNVIAALPKTMHPMSQFVSAISALQTESIFAEKYHSINKREYWDPAFEDALNVIAKLPKIAAMIYNHSYGNGVTPDADTSLDMAASFNRMIGFPAQGKPSAGAFIDPKESADAFDEYMRLYLTIHSDHEGGNVSAHSVRLVGSALSDPYLAFAAGMSGLAGPLHGLANQEVLDWTLKAQAKLVEAGKGLNKDTVRQLAWDTLNSGQVIPGFGHAVLRKTDPRYASQREFALKHMPKDELFKLVSLIYEVVPDVLTQHGKTKNPWPNVDAHSGCVLHHYGMTQTNFYTVLFGVSRAIGTLSQYVWDRALGHPIERPKSVDFPLLKKIIEEAGKK
jgi:citrate synthase